MGALIKKAKLESGRHSFEASGPSLPFRTVNQAAESPATVRCCRHNQASWPECLFMAIASISECPLFRRLWGQSGSGPTFAKRRF